MVVVGVSKETHVEENEKEFWRFAKEKGEGQRPVLVGWRQRRDAGGWCLSQQTNISIKEERNEREKENRRRKGGRRIYRRGRLHATEEECLRWLAGGDKESTKV